MSYHITSIEKRCFPDENLLTDALGKVNLTFNEIEEILCRFVCSDPVITGFGYQQSVATELESHLRSTLTQNNRLTSVSTKISPELNESADLAVAERYDMPAIFFELEFRPNFEKDLIKFQIAANRKKLLAGVLIVTVDRRKLNPGYTTMPEFRKVVRVVEEVDPKYPLLVIGLSGEHRNET